MRVLPAAAALALLTALLAPPAAAYAQPVFYFLKSDCSTPRVEGMCVVPTDPVPPLPVPPVVPVPVGVPIVAQAVLDPYSYTLANAPNATEPDSMPVYAGIETVMPFQFVTPANHSHPDRIRGPFLLGVWIGGSPAPHANLTATLYELKGDGTSAALANATVAIDLNASKAPDPNTLIPANQTDPQAILLYEVGQLAPMIYQPPNLFILGPVDIPFDANSSFAIGFRLDPGSSPSGTPLGVAQVLFNATFQPSFLYVPWYAPDPPRPTYSRSYTSRSFSSGPRGTFNGGGGADGGDEDDDKKKGIPGVEATLVLALVAVAAWAARRRL